MHVTVSLPLRIMCSNRIRSLAGPVVAQVRYVAQLLAALDSLQDDGTA